MATYNAAAVHLAAVAAWRNLTVFGRTDYGPPLEPVLPEDPAVTGAGAPRRLAGDYAFLPDELRTKQTSRTPRLLGTAGDPNITTPRRRIQTGRVTAVPLSKAAVGAVVSTATFGPISYPFMVQGVTISTDISRFNPGDGLVISALPFDKPVGSLEDNLIGAIPILGGQIDAAGTQFFAPGPTGQTAYFTPNIIVPAIGWYLRACGTDGGATPRFFGVLLQIATLNPEDIYESFIPEVTPEVIYQRSARAAPLPRPRQPAYPRAVIVGVSSGVYGSAKRTIPLSSLDPALLELALDPTTGQWRGAPQLTAVW